MLIEHSGILFFDYVWLVNRGLFAKAIDVHLLLLVAFFINIGCFVVLEVFHGLQVGSGVRGEMGVLCDDRAF